MFGVVTNEKGMKIREEMLPWLLSSYNVTEIQHDGSLFEQPALRYMQDFCKEKKVPCLYIHTKGAYNQRPETQEVRDMWKHEFTKNRDLYFALVDRPYPCVSTPFTGSDKTTWYNGFVANWQAMDWHPVINPNTNRMKFERLFRLSSVNVVGVVRTDIERNSNMTPICRKTMAMLK